jgi:hypothetical protein
MICDEEQVDQGKGGWMTAHKLTGKTEKSVPVRKAQ